MNFQEWCESGYRFDFEDKEKTLRARQFLEHLNSETFRRNSKFELYKHQLESIKRTIYAFEILGKKDLLLNIVTGGGKTVIMAGLLAYVRIVHDIQKFLILVPNTIVRQRLVDDFDQESDVFVFETLQFFYNHFSYLGDRLTLHVMKQEETPAGIRSANVILGNIHQLYEGKDNLKILLDERNVDRLVIFNDEAHNTKAKQYNLLLNKLKEKRFLRVDVTATPERLDGLHPDSEMIYEYNIKQAMRDKVVKRIVVFKPDIDSVKLSWKDENGNIYSVDQVPWEQIEQGWIRRSYDDKKVKIPAVRYVMDDKPATQLLNVALQCLEYQKKGVPMDKDGKPNYKPLLFVVTFSIADAKQIAKILRSPAFDKNVLVVHNESAESDKEIAMKLNKDMKNVPYDVVVSVMMLREGWDVKNISVICLYRKFCYKEIQGKKMSVYGPQVIGRGLRRIIVGKERWESLFVVDHPILKHDWLWDQLDAARYDTPLNPGEVIDERKIPAEPVQTIEPEKEDDAQKIREEINDWDKLAKEVPDYKEEREVITDWQKFLDDFEYVLEGVSIEEKINQVKSRNLDSGFNTLDREQVPDIDVSDITVKADNTAEELQKMILKEMSHTSRDALVEYDGNPDNRQSAIYDVLSGHIMKRFLMGSSVKDCSNKVLLEILWSAFSQIRENFFRPELVESILTITYASKH